MQKKESIGREATSKETLEDLEENEAAVKDTSDHSNPPSPDGAVDQPDELEGADPV